LHENYKEHCKWAIRFWCCCNHYAGVALECAVHNERNVREEKHYIRVARTNNNRVIAAHDLYCCLLPQREASCTLRSGFPIATVRVWMIVCIQKQYHHVLQTFRPLRMFKIVFPLSLYPKKLSLFCLLWLLGANLAETLVWKKWIWCQIMTSQTTHNKYKWHHTPLNEPPTWNVSVYATERHIVDVSATTWCVHNNMQKERTGFINFHPTKIVKLWCFPNTQKRHFCLSVWERQAFPNGCNVAYRLILAVALFLTLHRAKATQYRKLSGGTS